MYHCFQLNQEFSKEFSFLSQNISDHDNSQNVRILIKIIFPTSICLSPFKENCKESFLIPPPPASLLFPYRSTVIMCLRNMDTAHIISLNVR